MGLLDLLEQVQQLTAVIKDKYKKVEELERFFQFVSRKHKVEVLIQN